MRRIHNVYRDNIYNYRGVIGMSRRIKEDVTAESILGVPSEVTTVDSWLNKSLNIIRSQGFTSHAELVAMGYKKTPLSKFAKALQNCLDNLNTSADNEAMAVVRVLKAWFDRVPKKQLTEAIKATESIELRKTKED